MKKHFFFLTCVLFVVNFVSYAQFKPAVLNEKIENTDEYLAKGAISLLVKAVFFENYPNAVGDSWSKTKTGYIVHFSSGAIKHTAFLNKKGKMISMIRFLDENQLPATVQKLLQDYIEHMDGCNTIKSIREITTELGTAYLVSIFGSTTWRVVRVAGIDIETVEEHKKG
jgi:hypothetical protein